MIKFSIGIPAYKEKFLEKCVESILNQTYENFELIIVNDCSPQDLNLIVKKFDDKRIKYFENKKNVGAENVVNNWNKCLEHATGDYFVLMGDDDFMETNYLQDFLSLINKYPKLNVYHCRSNIIDEKNKVIEYTPSWPEYEELHETLWHRVCGLRKQYISDFVFKTQHLKKNEGFFYLPLAWGSDDITVFRACIDKGIAHTNKALLNYRINDLSITSTGNNLVKLDTYSNYYGWIKDTIYKLPFEHNANMINLLKLIPSIKRKKMEEIVLKYLNNEQILFKTKMINLYKLKKDKILSNKSIVKSLTSYLLIKFEKNE